MLLLRVSTAPVAEVLFNIDAESLRVTLLLLRFAAMARDLVLLDLPQNESAEIAEALTKMAKKEIPSLEEAFPDIGPNGFLSPK